MEYSFFIILEICIWSFKNSVNPAVGSGKKKKTKTRKSFAGSPSNSNELVEFGHKSKFPSHFALRRSSAVLYGGTLTGHQPSQPIPDVLETKKGGEGGAGGGNCPPVSWVMYACAGGNCERHGEMSVVHGGGNPRDESGRRAGEQAWKWRVRWRARTRDGWAAGMPDSLQEIESNSPGAKVAETND